MLVRSHALPEKAWAPGKPRRKHSLSSTSRPIAVGRAITGQFSCAATRAKATSRLSRPLRGASMPGPSTTIGSLTLRSGTEIAQRLRLPAWQPEVRVDGELHRIVLEGGSIDVNGRGTLITTEECLLSDVQQRNPGVSREHLEEAFRRLPRHREGDLAGARHCRRRYPRARGRHHPLRRRAHRGHCLRARSRRSQPRAAGRQFSLAEEEHRPIGQTA